MPWLLAFALLLGWEAFALATSHTTLTTMVKRASYQWPFLSTVVGLVVGVLLAHFFW